MVHASLRKLGPVEGRAAGVIDAIRLALGESGTMLMVLGAVTTEPFDAMTTPVDLNDMGVLAEQFRTYPGVRVNDHAADRFGAIGPLAAELLNDPPLHDYHGPSSVMHRFTDLGGRVLRLGADIDTVTLCHWAEYLADVPDKRRVRRRYVRADIGEQWIDSLDDCDGIKDWAHGDYFSQILIDFFTAGLARQGAVGSCAAELFEAGPFVDFAVRWMQVELR